MRDGGQKAVQRRRFDKARAGHVRHHHVARAHHLQQARHADARIGAQFDGIAELVVEPPQQDVHALQPGEGLQVQLVVAHREVLAFDERHAEIAREERVLEEGFAVRAGREQRDVRRAFVAGHRRAAALDERRDSPRVERREPLHAHRAERIGEHARDDQPVFERIAEPRRRLGAVRHDHPRAARLAREIDRDELQILPARRHEALHRTQIAGMPEHQRGRQEAFVQQRLRAVDVLHDRIEQLGALLDRAFQHRPLGLVDHERQQVERPRARLAAVRVDVVADVVVAHLLRDRLDRLVEPGNAFVAEQVEEGPPGVAQLTRLVAQFVPMPFPRGKGPQWRRQLRAFSDFFKRE